MLGKGLLWATAIIFGAYGMACFIDPNLPANYAGLQISNGDAYAEMGAMYGGLQFGFGLFCGICAFRPSLYRAGLMLLVTAIGCLAAARLYSAWDADFLVGVYTWGALAFETLVALVAARCLWR
ncbi:DUF4345 domain-containing protein [Halioglobus maricola]|uniref:DUF4345 domain-containing protein n=1 Tax=Halioglobus maricola TaxID=2601894 RepID=A0A5P9NJ00_9GAMM|nr:DUF4345 family protein [Halioglobus maricola]QFU75747.1 DUF4345 domain-containing protein [Halioglobus maricola]